jgi:internalin A
LLFHENLQTLVLHQATLPGIPAELLSLDYFTSCLDDLRTHVLDADAGAEEIHEAKLVVLGNGRIGKTQICRRLRGLPYDEKVPSSHGITVTSDLCAGEADGQVLNIWDFGGQDIYHGAHTLFMKTNAVFLIAWHPEFEDTGEKRVDGLQFRNYPLSYWLEYVRTLGRRDCPVVVVQARCERPEQEVRRLPVGDEFLQFPSSQALLVQRQDQARPRRAGRRVARRDPLPERARRHRHHRHRTGPSAAATRVVA